MPPLAIRPWYRICDWVPKLLGGVRPSKRRCLGCAYSQWRGQKHRSCDGYSRAGQIVQIANVPESKRTGEEGPFSLYIYCFSHT